MPIYGMEEPHALTCSQTKVNRLGSYQQSLPSDIIKNHWVISIESPDIVFSLVKLADELNLHLCSHWESKGLMWDFSGSAYWFSFFFFAALHSMLGLSFQTRDWTCAHFLTTGPLGKSLDIDSGSTLLGYQLKFEGPLIDVLFSSVPTGYPLNRAVLQTLFFWKEWLLKLA